MANTLEYTVLRIFPVSSCVNHHCRFAVSNLYSFGYQIQEKEKESAIYKYMPDMPDYHRLSVQLSDEKLGGDNT